MFPAELRVYATALSFSDSIWLDFGRRVSFFSFSKIAHHSITTVSAYRSLRCQGRDGAASLFKAGMVLGRAGSHEKYIQTQFRRRLDRNTRMIRDRDTE